MLNACHLIDFLDLSEFPSQLPLSLLVKCLPVSLFVMLPLVSLLRANLKSVFGQAVVFAIAQAFIYYIYAAGYYLGAFLVISDSNEVYHATYDEVFR